MKWYNNDMEIYKEIRAFYIKVQRPAAVDSKKMREALWSLSREINVCSIDIKNDEILIHSKIEFSPENWDASIRYLKYAILLFKKKYGYIVIRKVTASPDGLKTVLEGYKVTKRGIYNADIPGSKSFIDDLVRFSGRNKILQIADSIENILTSIDDPKKETGNEEL